MLDRMEKTSRSYAVILGIVFGKDLDVFQEEILKLTFL